MLQWGLLLIVHQNHNVRISPASSFTCYSFVSKSGHCRRNVRTCMFAPKGASPVPPSQKKRNISLVRGHFLRSLWSFSLGVVESEKFLHACFDVGHGALQANSAMCVVEPWVAVLAHTKEIPYFSQKMSHFDSNRNLKMFIFTQVAKKEMTQRITCVRPLYVRDCEFTTRKRLKMLNSCHIDSTCVWICRFPVRIKKRTESYGSDSRLSLHKCIDQSIFVTEFAQVCTHRSNMTAFTSRAAFVNFEHSSPCR